MKKWTTAFLVFDLMAGLLILGLWEQHRIAAAEGIVTAVTAQEQIYYGQVRTDDQDKEKQRSYTDGEASDADGAVKAQGEDIKKIALTFDDGVIIGLSQEISYIRSRFYDLVLF